MSHHHGDHNWPLILILAIFFPGVLGAIGLGYILLWVIKIVGIILLGILYLAYIYWPVTLAAAIVLLFIHSKKQKTKQIEMTKNATPISVAHVPEAIQTYHETNQDLNSGHVFSYDGSDNEEIKNLMGDHDIEEDVAERAQELIDEGLDEDDAVELAEGGI